MLPHYHGGSCVCNYECHQYTKEICHVYICPVIHRCIIHTKIGSESYDFLKKREHVVSPIYLIVSAVYYRTDIYVADFLGILVAFIITYTTATMIVW